MIASTPPTDRTRRAGFTMIEVLAAVLLTSIVISVAIAFQINLGGSMQSSRERLRTERLAIAMLDRIARDLRGAYYIIPAEGGNLRLHPWVFRTERFFAQPETPSDALKFMTRNYQSPGLSTHSSDLAVISYFLSPMPDYPAFELRRWRSSHMPSEYDPSFPTAEDPDALIMGEGIAKFGLTMIDQTGAEVLHWDSVRLGSRKGLPKAVRLELVMADPNELEASRFLTEDEFEADFDEDLSFSLIGGDGEYDEDDGGEEKVFSKLVVLPLSPLDWSFLESDTATAGDGVGDLDGDGIPDSEDDDVDGDGIPNDEDDDFDPADFGDAFDDEYDDLEGDDGEDPFDFDEAFEDGPSAFEENYNNRF